MYLFYNAGCKKNRQDKTQVLKIREFETFSKTVRVIKAITCKTVKHINLKQEKRSKHLYVKNIFRYEQLLCF